MALKRALSGELMLYRDARFPRRYARSSALRYRVFVGIGGNIGDVRRRFHRLCTALQRQRGVQLMQTGPVLENPPFGYTEQPPFFNSVMEVATSMQPRAFLRFLLRMEKRFGRKRSFANAPRTLDLDILFFDERIIETPDLTLPHPHWQERASVIIPLSYCRR